MEHMSDAQILTEIDLIEEGMQECGRRSSYTERTRPYYKALCIEADKRGLEIP